MKMCMRARTDIQRRHVWVNVVQIDKNGIDFGPSLQIVQLFHASIGVHVLLPGTGKTHNAGIFHQFSIFTQHFVQQREQEGRYLFVVPRVPIKHFQRVILS